MFPKKINKKSKNKIPKNDIDSWNFYPNLQNIYNKMELCKYQNIPYSPMPILPTIFPVIIKPIINLSGMGLNSFKVNNPDEFIEHWFHTGYWMEFIHGIHYSFDIILINGRIKFYVCFQGFPGRIHGTFNYWELVNMNLPSICKSFIKDKLVGFNGCVNVECINDKMIEFHLRMGDIFHLPDINKPKIKFHNNKKYYIKKEPRKQLYNHIIDSYNGIWDLHNYIPIKTFIIPIWNDKYIKLNKDIVSKLCKDPDIIHWEIEDEGLAHPPGIIRLMILICYSLNVGLKIRDKIIQSAESTRSPLTPSGVRPIRV